MSTTIESLELEIQSNSASATNGIDALTRSLNKLKTATAGLSSFSIQMGKVADTTKVVKEWSDKASASFTDLYHKLKVVANGFKALGTAIYSALKKSMDYTENLNLFSVAMGEYASKAKDYAEEVSDALGIDTSEWIRAQGIFMTLGTGFGVASDRAYTMSKNLTQLAYDLASFYNMDTETAMVKLKSGFAGELEPLRDIGYDLSQARLEAIALEKGITKSVSAMTQAEKAQLRYYAIMTQVTTAQGDMARTLEDPANQMRVFKAQCSMATREIGNAFIPALNAILPYATAAAKVIGSLANSIAGLFGYKDKSIGESTNVVVENTNKVTENLQDGQEEAKKLKSYMLGFDELNVINPNSNSTEDDSGWKDFELPEYNMLENLVESKVATIVKEMKEWLGITDDIDSWSELLETRLGNILVAVGAIGAGFALWKIGAGVITAINGIATAIGNISKAVKAIMGSKFIGWLTAFISLVKEYGFVAAFKAAFPKLAAAIGTIAPYALPVIGIIAGLVGYIWGLVDAIKEGIGWIDALVILLGQIAIGASIGFLAGGPWGALIGAAIGVAVGLITDFTVWLWQKFDSIEEWFNGLPGIIKLALIPLISGMLGGMLAGGLITWIPLLIIGVVTLIKKFDDLVAYIKSIPSRIAELPNTISDVFSSIHEEIKNLPNTVKSKLDEILGNLDTLSQNIKTWFSDTQEKVKQWFADLWQPIKDYNWSNLGKDIGKWFGNAVKNAYTFVTKTVPEWFEDLEESILTGFETFFTVTLPMFFTETLPVLLMNIATFFNELPSMIISVITSVWDGFINVGKEILRGIFEGFVTVHVAIWDFCKGFVQGFMEALGIESAPSTVFMEIGVYLIEGLLGGITERWVKITTFFSTAFENLNTSFSTAWGKIETTVKGIFDGMWTHIKKTVNLIIGGVEKMTNGVINGLNSMIGALNNLSFTIPDWAPGDMAGKTFGLNIRTISTISIPRLADGGFVDAGQMFIAREAGPEMVGSIGRRTAVANNDQIVGGIASGVAEANEEQNALLREQNSLLRAILEKDSGVYLDGKNLTNSVEKYQRERGRGLIVGGVV